MYEKIKVAGSSPRGGTGTDGDDGQCSFCDRPKGTVICNSCLKVHTARVRRVCSKHPKVSFMMDWTKCPNCRSDNIQEIGSCDGANRPVAQTPPLTPALVHGLPPSSTPPKMAFKNMEPDYVSPPAAKKVCSQTVVAEIENKMDVDEDEYKNMDNLVITRSMKQSLPGVALRKVDIVPSSPLSSSRYTTPMPVRTTTTFNAELAPSRPREVKARGRSQVQLPRFEDEALAAKQHAAQLAKVGKHESPIPPSASMAPDYFRQTAQVTPIAKLEFSVPPSDPSTPGYFRQPPQSCNLPSTTSVDCPCFKDDVYLLCTNCGFYGSKQRKYFRCSIHAKEGGIKKCPECNTDVKDMDEMAK